MVSHISLSSVVLEHLLIDVWIVCTKNVQFLINGSMYIQTNDVTETSLLGLILVDIVMSLPKNSLRKSMDQLTAYYIYVDKNFVLCKDREQANTILKF